MTWLPVVLMSIPVLKIQIMTHELRGIKFLLCRRSYFFNLHALQCIGWTEREQWTLWRLHRVLILTSRQMCDHQCGSNPYPISKLFQHSTKNFLSFQFKVDPKCNYILVFEKDLFIAFYNFLCPSRSKCIYFQLMFRNCKNFLNWSNVL